MTRPEPIDALFSRRKYVRLAEACDRCLGISVSTFYRYLHLGVITTVKRLPGGHIRLDRPTLEQIESELLRAEVLGEREPVDDRTLPLPFPGL